MRAPMLGLTGAVFFATVAVWLGLKVGLMTAYFSGVVGFAAGWYLGAQFGRRYLG